MTRSALIAALAAATAFVLAVGGASSGAAGGTSAPLGLTGIALAGDVQLAWQPVAGASGYTVYRGGSVSTVTTRLTAAAGVTGTTYDDGTAVNGTTYDYAVRAIVGGVESPSSLVVQATPVARGCSTGNPTVLENCYPGNTGFKVVSPAQISAGGIEGYATAQSIEKGGSVGLKVNAADGATFDVQIYRTGYYGGKEARLFSVLKAVPAERQPGCVTDADTGLLDCSNWDLGATVTTTSAWPSGVYVLRLVRLDTGTDSQILFVVRDDARHSDLLYGAAMSTFQAYNNYGGKSLYTFNSSGGTTVSGTARAVKVSYDRPFEQPRSGLRDWYTNTEIATVAWLEESGYDVTYAANTDLDSSPGLALDHKAYISPAHDEYVSSGMRAAMTQARDAGVNLWFSGSNEDYWRIRFEASAVSGEAGRVQVCYKTVESGAADPSGISTSTWRDPNGPDQPENALSGEMYVGDNDTSYFPLVVTAAEGKDRLFRYTGLDQQAAGTSTSIGSNLVGWEWDARVANGDEPADVTTLTSSPVTGNLSQGNGHDETPGSTTVSAVKYVAPSGALVFTTGTNHWNRGLALNAFGVGEPDVRIRQITTNALEDMGALPQTPDDDIVLDPPATVAVTATVPADGATGVARSVDPRVTFSAAIDPTSLTSSSLFLKSGGSTVPAAISYDGPSRTATLTPSTQLAASTAYTLNVTTAVRTTGGTPLATATTVSFTTAAPVAPTVTSTFPAAGAGSVSPSTTVQATFDRAVAPATLTGGFTLTGAGTTVPATVSYDAGSTTATLVPSSALALATVYTARLSTAVTGADGTPLAAAVTWSFTTASSPPAAPTVTSRSPASSATGVLLGVHVSAVFSTDMSASSFGPGSFTLTSPKGAVAATVAYDGASRTATLTPSASLTASTTYTATIAGTVRGADGTPLGAALSWTFTTIGPPTVTTTAPADGAGAVATDSSVTAVFSRAMDASSLTGAFTLTAAGGATVDATVSYDASTTSARLVPSAPLAGDATYTARVGATAAAADGTPLGQAVSWTFTTAACPCSLHAAGVVPAETGLPTQDGRSGAGPWSYELGAKLTADESSTLTAIRFYKSPGETGSHVGRIWTVDGFQLASVAFSSETASGWQQQALATPLELQPGSVYVVSVNANAFFVSTTGGLAASSGTGPLHTVADGANGVFGAAAGTFPTGTWSSSDYFVDVLASPDASVPAPTVTSTTPADGAASVPVDAAPTATFSRAVDPSTVTSTSFTLTGPSGAVASSVSYDATSRTAMLTPTAALAAGTAYTARVGTAVHASDGTPLAAATSWTFTTAPAARPQATALAPLAGSSDAGPSTLVRAVFSLALDPSTVSTSTFTLADGSKAISGSVSYDAGSSTATFTPSSPLVAGETYTARLDPSIATPAGGTLGSAVTWSFTIAAAAAPPTVVATTPASGATGVVRAAPLTAGFSRSMDPTTIDGSTFRLTDAGGTAVAATVAFDAASKTATLTPSAPLASLTTYTATVTTGAEAADETPLAADVSWTFTTAACPCTLFPSTLKPAATGLPTQDGRSGSGPFSYELGVKVQVDAPTQATALRFYKSPGETGTHVGRIWSPTGTLLASVTFAGETASGWQQQALASPFALQPGTVYTVSVNANADFVSTLGGLKTAAGSGPLHSVADGANGVFASAAGSFPTQTYGSSNYFVDLVGDPGGGTAAPTVASTSPAAGAVGVAQTSTVSATFSRALDPATVTGSTFTLTGPSGAVVATVSYDTTTNTATLTPSAPLAYSTAYTARLGTGVQAADGTALAAPVTWSFTVVDAPRPTVSSTLPAAGATGVAGTAAPRATFSRALDPATVSTSTFTLTGPGGAVAGTVAYDPNALAATFTPSASLPAGTYTATIAASVATPDHATLGSAYTWSFTVSAGVTAFAVTSGAPAAGATGVARTTAVTAVFSRALDPSTATAANVQLHDASGGNVAATVAYDDASRTVTLTPGSPLAASAVYTVVLSDAVQASDGTPLAGGDTWSFTTAACPCSLFGSSDAPSSTGNPTSDGRSGSGPFSYELGVKIAVDSPVQLTAIRFYKDAHETGTHVGSVWSSAGTLLGSVTFGGESASGWQQQALSSPVALAPGNVYVVSVDANAFFGDTKSGLATAISSGPLHTVADGANGVFGASAGTFPTQTYSSTDYFVDVVVG